MSGPVAPMALFRWAPARASGRRSCAGAARMSGGPAGGPRQSGDGGGLCLILEGQNTNVHPI